MEFSLNVYTNVLSCLNLLFWIQLVTWLVTWSRIKNFVHWRYAAVFKLHRKINACFRWSLSVSSLLRLEWVSFFFKMELLIIKGWIFEKKVTFESIKFCYNIGEVHSKRERLEIIVLHLKSRFIWCSLLNPSAILQICDIFMKSVTWHVTWPYKMLLSLKNVKDSESCPCAKFRFNYVFVARNIANKHFSLKKAPDPGLKHLENAVWNGIRRFLVQRALIPYVCLVWSSGWV